MARNEQEIPHRLHSISDEPAMAGGEPCTTANADTAVQTTPNQAKHTGMKYMARELNGVRFYDGEHIEAMAPTVVPSPVRL